MKPWSLAEPYVSFDEAFERILLESDFFISYACVLHLSFNWSLCTKEPDNGSYFLNLKLPEVLSSQSEEVMARYSDPVSKTTLAG